MTIKYHNAGLQAIHQIKFDWQIEDYDIRKTYKNVYEDGEDVIMLMLRAEYDRGEVVRATPYIMFNKLSSYKRGYQKTMKFTVSSTGAAAHQVGRQDWPKLHLNESYSSKEPFLRPKNYKHAMVGRDLILHFHIQIKSPVSEKLSTFDNSRISKDFRSAFEKQAFCDCQFIVEGMEIGAHMVFISANCAGLTKALEKSDNKLVINDCTVDAFQELLKFIYSGKIDRKDLDILVQLTSLANVFDFQRMKEYCEWVMCDKLHTENPNVIFQSCFKYNLSEQLKRDSFHEIQRIFEAINQKLPDDFINDPAHVDYLMSVTETLMNGLKKRAPPKIEIEPQHELIIENHDDVEGDDGEDNTATQEEVTREMLESCSMYLSAENEGEANLDDEGNIPMNVEDCARGMNLTFSGGDVDGLEYDEFELEISTKDQSDSEVNAEIDGYKFMENLEISPYPHVLDEIIEEENESDLEECNLSAILYENAKGVDKDVDTISTAIARVEIVKLESNDEVVADEQTTVKIEESQLQSEE